MGNVFKDKEGAYKFKSDNGIVYELIEGKQLGNNRNTDIIYIMLDHPNMSTAEYVGWEYGSIHFTEEDKWGIKAINEIVKEYESEHPEVLKLKPPMPEGLKDMLNQLLDVSVCGGIRSYFDLEIEVDDEEFSYMDSGLIFNLMSCCEEVAMSLLDEDVKGAEEVIRTYMKDNF